MCLARTLLFQGDAEAAAETLKTAKEIQSKLTDDFLCGWSPAVPAIEAEIASKQGDYKLAESLYELADSKFDIQRVRQNYTLFLKNAPYCKLMLPNEQIVLQDLISVLRKEGKIELAVQKEKVLEGVRRRTRKLDAEECLTELFGRLDREIAMCSLSADSHDLAKRAISAVQSETDCSPDFKLGLLERFAKNLIEHSYFASAIDLINATLRDRSFESDRDFRFHALCLQQLKIRALVTSGQPQSAQTECADFFAKYTDGIPRLRNQKLDVLGWQARIKLLNGRPFEAREELEKLCRAWDKDGTNTFISDFREHVRDFATAQFLLHQYSEAAQTLRYYLAKLSYNNGSESDEANSLLGLTYQKLGNAGLGRPLVDEVVSRLKEGDDDIERVYAVTYVADFFLAANDKPTALKFYRRADLALRRLSLQRLPVASYVKVRLGENQPKP